MTDSTIAYHPDHNHEHCVSQALQDAQRICQSKSLRLTAIRELVLKLIWQSHKPLGAYDLLPAIAEAGFNSAPPTVYRALDFLQEQGFVHRIASLNAFIGCTNPEHPHQGYFLICQACGVTVELNSRSIEQSIHNSAAELGFVVEHENVEVVGRCPNCPPEAK
ncbi:Fur family transcriptional regulator [Aliamphritea ceti]|uniref:Fur family transcriptional regulator n=1 Tax=Aliamphritea ceti TaxID=1524258 RepID=UPI0021C27B58|nr:Fur family transcriptional regulator [Aliamphritea ceti]